MNKKLAQRAHAKRRAKSRFGIELNRTMRNIIVEEIQKGSSEYVKFLEKQSNRISKFEAVIDGKSVILVYDKIRHNLVTMYKNRKKKNDL